MKNIIDFAFDKLLVHCVGQNFKGWDPYDGLNSWIIQKTFLIRLCEDSYFESRKKPCLQYQIKRCSSPCVGLIKESDYEKSVNSAVMFLKGETKSLFLQMEKEMNYASNKKEYELAAKYRDSIITVDSSKASSQLANRPPSIGMIFHPDGKGSLG